ncbi:hypothetical protein M011DRAFT_212071 [Sporormia fimetaria CBS 119925]|uniref:Uncharacterized protein n=1 Tax=Sporormia fimetaria CBS 119925 TaxID=1340428 RepID=A0A6A6V2E7_9PLEO|nr:hypothetical protein M011DRAFT_212071 [Sporormia fimetaria CBS 119925]
MRPGNLVAAILSCGFVTVTGQSLPTSTTSLDSSTITFQAVTPAPICTSRLCLCGRCLDPQQFNKCACDAKLPWLGAKWSSYLFGTGTSCRTVTATCPPGDWRGGTYHPRVSGPFAPEMAERTPAPMVVE